ncbi:hypothetical protein H6P81_008076 [Aristolochia fimbriata]|uniref:Uncharacterized protein n=1 Tax=Aristolochia fimbriata TaxID=158543 RepID=A0AAV7F5A6_ARIFI|nr:hypothetical protein H6P81_008076 [Aristolochia fimbriata]
MEFPTLIFSSSSRKVLHPRSSIQKLGSIRLTYSAHNEFWVLFLVYLLTRSRLFLITELGIELGADRNRVSFGYRGTSTVLFDVLQIMLSFSHLFPCRFITPLSSRFYVFAFSSRHLPNPGHL